jgi:hypothetical protein
MKNTQQSNRALYSLPELSGKFRLFVLPSLLHLPPLKCGPQSGSWYKYTGSDGISTKIHYVLRLILCEFQIMKNPVESTERNDKSIGC